MPSQRMSWQAMVPEQGEEGIEPQTPSGSANAPPARHRAGSSRLDWTEEHILPHPSLCGTCILWGLAGAMCCQVVESAPDSLPGHAF